MRPVLRLRNTYLFYLAIILQIYNQRLLNEYIPRPKQGMEDLTRTFHTLMWPLDHLSKSAMM